mgnify:CR=1 FL=1
MSERYDLLIRDAEVVDGTGAARFRADIGLRADRIAAIGRLHKARADVEIDASGKAVAPGFIDAHTHDDRLLLSGPEMAAKVSQGVATVVAGNCCVSLAPFPHGIRLPVTPPLDLLDESGSWFRFPSFGAYVEELRSHPPATNAVLLVGHTTLRVVAMDNVERPASAAEIGRRRELAHEALAAGASGVSTGLYYEPAAAAPTGEVIEVCRPLREAGGLYCTHMRNEADRVLDPRQRPSLPPGDPRGDIVEPVQRPGRAQDVGGPGMDRSDRLEVGLRQVVQSRAQVHGALSTRCRGWR